ncbi:MAG: GNAT family N-acetyltransferase [Rhodoglobus sp.]
MNVSVAVEPARQPEVEALLARGDDFAFGLYPADSCYLLDVSELERAGVSMFVARVDGVAAGTAALVERGDGSAELKRLFVDDSARGKGLAAGLLTAIEAHARDAAVRVIQLETGPKSFAAIALYEKHGYVRIPNFGQYVGDPHSYCMEKAL